jgi:hypothetical protein
MEELSRKRGCSSDFVVGAAAPDFCVVTSRGARTPADCAGQWLAFVHCTVPCENGCNVCLKGLRFAAEWFRAARCRVLVAVDQSSLTIAAPKGGACVQEEPPETVEFGVCEPLPPAEGAAPIVGQTTIAIIDPQGVVRALSRFPTSRPILAEEILSLFDHARGPGGSAVRASRALTEPNCYGCVDWFPYDRVASTPRARS